MKSQGFFLSILLAIAWPLFGQQLYFVHDADGERLGQLIDAQRGDGTMWLRADDGCLVNFHLQNGHNFNSGADGFRYKSNDCTGQAYVDYESNGVLITGNKIVPVQNDNVGPT